MLCAHPNDGLWPTKHAMQRVPWVSNGNTLPSHRATMLIGPKCNSNARMQTPNANVIPDRKV
jgi:hypothetical protein